MKRKHITNAKYNELEIKQLRERAERLGFPTLGEYERHLHQFEPAKRGTYPRKPKANKHLENKSNIYK